MASNSPSASDGSPKAGATPQQVFSPYGYVPTEWICITFIVLFSLSTATHIVQTIHSRLWFLLPTACLAGVGELIGWGARLWSSHESSLIDPYLMQISATIVAPTPLIAGSFIVLGQIIRRIGQDYSRLTAKSYSIVFLACDIVALVIQALGGAKASIAVKSGNNPEPGGNIMLAGVSFQMAALAAYVVLSSEFLLRYIYDHPFKRAGDNLPVRSRDMPTKTRLMIVGLALEAVFLFIRSIYRVVELTDGWAGTVITTQSYFNIFDGAMILLAMFTLNFFHPGHLLGHTDIWASKDRSYTDIIELDSKNGQSQLSDV